MSGLSFTPLSVALGIKPGTKVSLINPPPGFASRLNPLPEGVEFLVTARTGLDVILFFPADVVELVDRLPALARAMAVTGGLWVAFPRPPGPRERLTEDFVRQAALDIGLVDNKLWSVTPDHSALRLVWRPRPRPERPNTGKQRVAQA
ncbi:MAG: hypothetical protein RL653_912 [Pseudomonadota bacterium]|jgi:hypothetical protein